MKTKGLTSILPSNHLVRIALVTALLLLVPLVVMQFSKDVNWSLIDFVVAGILLFGTGLLLNLVMLKTRSNTYRLVLGTVIVIVFLYIWAELAVGVFTNWGS